MRATPLALLAAFALGLVLHPAPARAQLGLDLSDDDKPVKKKKHEKRHRAVEPPPAPAAAPAPPPEAASPSLPAIPPAPASARAPESSKQKKAPFPGLGLDLSDEPSTKAGPASTAAVDPARMAAARGLFQDQRWEEASLALSGVLADAAPGSLRSEAEYDLGRSLFHMGMLHSSLSVFRRILDRGRGDPFFEPTLSWLFYISHKAVNQQVVLDEIARLADAPWPAAYRPELRYLLAKYNFVRGKALLDAAAAVDDEERRRYESEAQKSFTEEERLAALVPRDSPFWPRARYLDGLTHYVRGEAQPSLEAMKDVVRALNPRTAARPDLDLREQAFMQLARIHYEYNQNRYSIYYFEKVRRGGGQWLESLFESAWAHFRVGEYEEALGNMVTLHSPFFREAYFPESFVLESVLYYENCRYPEALRLVDEFEQRYEPLRKEIDELLARKVDNPEGWYEILDSVQRAAPEDVTGKERRVAQILELALSDKDLQHQNEALKELRLEGESIENRSPAFRDSLLAKDLVAALATQRTELAQKAGFYARRKLMKEQAVLADLSYRALAIRAEIGTREKEHLEAQLTGAKGELTLKNYKYSTAVDDEHVYWPYEGEYWRDELGTYAYTLTRGCRNK